MGLEASYFSLALMYHHYTAVLIEVFLLVPLFENFKSKIDQQISLLDPGLTNKDVLPPFILVGVLGFYKVFRGIL